MDSSVICDYCGAPATAWFKKKAIRVCDKPECSLWFENRNPINLKLHRPNQKPGRKPK